MGVRLRAKTSAPARCWTRREGASAQRGGASAVSPAVRAAGGGVSLWAFVEPSCDRPHDEEWPAYEVAHEMKEFHDLV